MVSPAILVTSPEVPHRLFPTSKINTTKSKSNDNSTKLDTSQSCKTAVTLQCQCFANLCITFRTAAVWYFAAHQSEMSTPNDRNGRVVTLNPCWKIEGWDPASGLSKKREERIGKPSAIESNWCGHIGHIERKNQGRILSLVYLSSGSFLFT